MGNLNRSMSLAGEPPKALNTGQKLAVITGMTGMGILILQLFNLNLGNSALWLSIAILAIFAGIIWFSQAAYAHKHKGIKNDGVWFKSMSSRGVLAWMAGIALTGFYIVLYFYPQYLGLVKDGDNTGLIALFDPLSKALSGNPASQWFVYGTLYTVAILAFGAKFIWKYRHNKYEQLRTVSVMFFQTAFAFFIPEIMARLNGDLPYYDLKNMWPLNYYNFERYRINGFIDSGSVGMTMLFFGIISIFVISPFLTYKYGKRWYCSWVCGCGGLAETAGDSFRQLSDKSKFAWKVERWVVHSVVVFVTLMTTAVIYSYLGNDTSKYWLTKTMFISGVAIILTAVFAWVMIYKRDELEKDAKYGAIGYFTIIAVLIGMHFFSGSGNIFIFKAETLRSTYSFLIGSIFSGVIGTGFYPILGNRVWCRFGCPMAAILGFQQRMFSKFRITTNGGQCISCGNCSTYCEMGIDVRAYAQKGANIVRSSCVGCGICSAVCPRGVLKLENGPEKGRIDSKEVLLGNDVDLMDLVNKN
ncbi:MULTISPECIES: 4Fe-4S binding protein [Maribacter]|uniref:4Fe-4S binding domain-containing protein n=1 Tax=Maribacter dokdonensis TaxID=320912 RepID=A0A1H4K023_9FLAO|nr:MULTISPECIES: 4Fe-4S dicluster domain-containing protein [Maribacter]KSA13327.1 Iron-sulfur cluster-binding protein [Maribacter dokdonensis DSW-8]CAG2534148.1 4Fe-4S binding domain-containing protein [Maribacter dokdonensis]SEB51904.1 4Fe-4S binding domain-containing protein [Maribacter dokdonensis]|tara:strand:+ start:97751 stop:99334 length:1584 start_codon:yes stop_codon:yes gene_type:complete